MFNIHKMNEGQICRLCLKVAKDDFEIDEVTKQMFESLLIKLDLGITRDPIICQECMNVAKQCLNFKYTFINTEKTILSYSAGRNQVKHEHDIKVIYEEREHVQTVLGDNLNICRFCSTSSERNKLTSLDFLMNENMFEMLSTCMAEMDFNTIENPLVCPNCKENLNHYFKFVLTCLNVEEKIKAYCKEKGTDNIGQINLSNVLLFMLTDVIEYPDESSQTYKNHHGHTYHKRSISDMICLDTRENNTKWHTYQKNGQGNIMEDPSFDGDILELNINENFDMKINEPARCNKGTKLRKTVNSNTLVYKDGSLITQKCSLCAYETKHKYSIKRHMMVHKDVSEIKMHKCSLCTYETKYKSSLKPHMLVHKDSSQIKMYKCSLCTHQTKQKSNLTTHMLIHKDVSEVQMYKCPLCTYETKRKGYLITHNRLVHNDASEIKMEQCSLCTFKTKHKRKLNEHMLVHKDLSEIKMFKCLLCTYETTRKSSLKQHMLVHKDVSELNMHKCSLCSYEAKHKDRLNKHMLIHKDISEIKMYKCALCAHETKRKYNLSTHIMLVHKHQK